MAKKKTGKHLRFYYDCMSSGQLPHDGLCNCARYESISKHIFENIIPTDDDLIELWEERYIAAPNKYSYWGSETKIPSHGIGIREYEFNPLRQTIVLFMAALNNEL